MGQRDEEFKRAYEERENNVREEEKKNKEKEREECQDKWCGIRMYHIEFRLRQ